MAKRIVAKTGAYTNRDGEQKNEWLELGVLLSNVNGEYMILKPEIDLAGVLMKQRILAQKTGGKVGDGVMCSIFERDNQGQGGQSQQQAPSGGDDFDDDIPF